MERVRSIKVWRHEQKTPSAYLRMHRAARAWVREEKLRVHDLVRAVAKKRVVKPSSDPADSLGLFEADIFFDLIVPDEARRRLEALVRAFGPGAKVHRSRTIRPEAEDFATADYVTLWGAAVRGGATEPEASAFVEGPRCRCGGGAIDMPQIADLRVDSRKYLRWDVVNANGNPCGGIVISLRVATMLKTKGFTGYETRRVLDAVTGKPIPMVQLVANRAVLAPCVEHDRTGVTFCKGCGSGLVGGERKDGLTVSRTATGGDDVIAGQRYRYAFLYVSQRLREALVAMRAKGLGAPTDFLHQCTHARRKASSSRR